MMAETVYHVHITWQTLLPYGAKNILLHGTWVYNLVTQTWFLSSILAAVPGSPLSIQSKPPKSESML